MGDNPYKYCNLQWEIIHTLLSCDNIFFVHVYICIMSPLTLVGDILLLSCPSVRPSVCHTVCQCNSSETTEQNFMTLAR